MVSIVETTILCVSFSNVNYANHIAKYIFTPSNDGFGETRCIIMTERGEGWVLVVKYRILGNHNSMRELF